MFCLCFQSEEEEEEDEEELPPFSPSPTLSITEEILELINQSRAREGLSVIVDATVRPVAQEPRGPGAQISGLLEDTHSLPLILCPCSSRSRTRTRPKMVHLSRTTSPPRCLPLHVPAAPYPQCNRSRQKKQTDLEKVWSGVMERRAQLELWK